MVTDTIKVQSDNRHVSIIVPALTVDGLTREECIVRCQRYLKQLTGLLQEIMLNPAIDTIQIFKAE